MKKLAIILTLIFLALVAIYFFIFLPEKYEESDLYDEIFLKDRNVAVKVLRGDLATDEKFVRRFQREALSASSLHRCCRL